MENIKIGLIGLGYWGKILSKAIESGDGMSLYAVCDRHQENLDISRAVVKFKDSESLIRCPDVDLVVIATQMAFQEQLVRQSLLAGKHVFVEKPFTGSYKVAKELVDLAESLGLFIFVDLPYLFSKKMELMKNKLQGHKVNLVKMRRCDFGRFPKDCGIVPHLMFHDLYIVDHLFGDLGKGENSQLSQYQLVSPWYSDYAVAQLIHSKGIKIHMTSDMTCLEKVRQIEFHHSNGYFYWDDLKDDWFVAQDLRVSVIADRAEYKTKHELKIFGASDVQGDDPLRQQLESACRGIAAGQDSLNTAQISLRVLSVIEGLD